MRGVQRGAAVDAQHLCRLLKLLVIGLIFLHLIIFVLIFVLVAAAGRPISLPLLDLAAASSSAGTFLVGPTSSFLGLLFVAPLVFSFLLLNKLLDSLTVLKIMALGAVDLAVPLVGAILLVGGHHSLAGVIGFCLVGSASIAGMLNS